MNKLIPVILLLAAGCSAPPPDLSAITKELAALRQGLEEIRKGQQPTFDKEQVLADLTAQIDRALRDHRLREVVGQVLLGIGVGGVEAADPLVGRHAVLPRVAGQHRIGPATGLSAQLRPTRLWRPS